MRKAAHGWTCKAMATVAWLAVAEPARAIEVDMPLHQMVHQVWRAEDGLPQNSVFRIVPTRDGFVWVATQEGLARFDGEHFTVFDSSNTDVIRSNWIFTLLEDRGGTLWAGTYTAGLVSYNQGRMRLYDTTSGLPNNRVRALLQDARGDLWVGTYGGGLAVRREGRFETFGTKQGLSSDNVLSLAEDRQGNLWIATLGGGLNRLQKEKFFQYTTKEGLANDKVLCVYVDRKDRVWAGTYGGLSRFEDGRFISYGKADGLPDEKIRTLWDDEEGNLWIGTYNGGLAVYRDGKFTHHGSKEGLAHDAVLSVVGGREGNLWVGTNGGGLSLIRPARVQTLSTLDGLSHEQVKSYVQAPDGSLWIGTQKGLNLYRDGRVVPFDGQDKLASDEVRSLFLDRSDRLWVGTAAGLKVIEGGVVTLFEAAGQKIDGTVYAILQDRAGTFWFGVIGKGLVRWSDAEIQTFGVKDGLAGDNVWALHEDRSGVLWIGTTGGLSRFEGGKFRNYFEKDGLGSDVVLSLLEDPEGGMWVGTLGGLSLIENDRVFTVRKRQGLFDDGVFTIVLGEQDDLWMSCNKGIFTVPRKEVRALVEGTIDRINCTALGVAQGMKSNECNGGGLQYPAWHTSDHKIWFATMEGAAAVNLLKPQTNRVIPPVYLTAIVANGTRVDAEPGLVLPSSTENIELHYTAPSFVDPKAVRFKYKLEGFDKDWVDAAARRVAYYTNLDPGAYVFRVIAANNDGYWNEQGTSLAFAVQPLYYQTLWFRVLLFATGLLSIGGVVRLRTRMMQRRNEALEAVVAEKTSQLQSANAELRAVNAELEDRSLRDPLTGLRNRRYLTEVLTEEAAEAAVAHRLQREGAQLRKVHSVRPYAVFLLDIDFFKRVNDEYGHKAGDVVLQQLADIFQSNTRRGDIIARWGGEEFVIILRDCEPSHVPIFAQRIRQDVESHPFRLPAGEVVHRTCSMGYLTFPFYDEQADLVTLEQCMAIADLGLYYAKRHGRNASVRLLPGRVPARDELLAVVTELDFALEEGYLALEVERGPPPRSEPPPRRISSQPALP